MIICHNKVCLVECLLSDKKVMVCFSSKEPHYHSMLKNNKQNKENCDILTFLAKFLHWPDTQVKQ